MALSPLEVNRVNQAISGLQSKLADLRDPRSGFTAGPGLKEQWERSIAYFRDYLSRGQANELDSEYTPNNLSHELEPTQNVEPINNSTIPQSIFGNYNRQSTHPYSPSITDPQRSSSTIFDPHRLRRQNVFGEPFFPT